MPDEVDDLNNLKAEVELASRQAGAKDLLRLPMNSDESSVLSLNESEMAQIQVML